MPPRTYHLAVMRTEARVGGFDDVVEDGVGDLLVERALVAVAPKEVHLQALELDAELVGNHVDGEVREVGLAGPGQWQVNSGTWNWIT